MACACAWFRFPVATLSTIYINVIFNIFYNFASHLCASSAGAAGVAAIPCRIFPAADTIGVFGTVIATWILATLKLGITSDKNKDFQRLPSSASSSVSMSKCFFGLWLEINHRIINISNWNIILKTLWRNVKLFYSTHLWKIPFLLSDQIGNEIYFLCWPWRLEVDWTSNNGCFVQAVWWCDVYGKSNADV